MKHIVRTIVVSAITTLAQPAWAADLSATATQGEVTHKQQMGIRFPQPPTSQGTPPFLPQYQIDADEEGSITTYQPNGATVTVSNGFFQNLGTNGRTCFTCHQSKSGWGLSVNDAQDRFAANPSDPLFRLVDGATCPSDDVATPAAMQKAYSLLLNKGLIRIGLPMQASMNFQILGVNDPYGCSTNPVTGLTGQKSGILSFYRRPLPSANLGFLTAIMWDGREPDLFHQSIDATLGHAQGNHPPTVPQQQQIVSFEGCTTALTPAACASIQPGAGVFTSQTTDNAAGDLYENGAPGGPTTMADLVAGFSLCLNDPFGGIFGCPKPNFDPAIFEMHTAWAKLTGTDQKTLARLAIARGEQVFDSVTFNISGVAGLNDVTGQKNIKGTCGTCHDVPNAGNHSVPAQLNIGVTDPNPPGLDVSGLPVFTVLCTGGPLTGKTFQVTDLGRAMITGNCADIGKTKAPVLRGLPARSPYFHNGAAPEIANLIDFYDQRFSIGLTDQQKADLAVFLETL